MSDWRRPLGRLLSGLLSVGMMIGGSTAATPSLTTVVDTVYRADGAPAAGTLLISWAAFSTTSGAPVAAGTKSVTLGPQGALSVSLVPNVGAAPAGTYYTVVFQLDDPL